MMIVHFDLADQDTLIDSYGYVAKTALETAVLTEYCLQSLRLYHLNG